MNAKNFYVALILIVFSPLYYAHSAIPESAILENAIIIIQEIKKSFNFAHKATESICVSLLPRNSAYFSQENRNMAAKAMILISIFNLCNKTNLALITEYRSNSHALIKAIKSLPPRHQFAYSRTFENQTKTSWTIKDSLSRELSVYLNEIKETFKSHEKNFLQSLFNNLKNICPELDPQILSE